VLENILFAQSEIEKSVEEIDAIYDEAEKMMLIQDDLGSAAR